MKYGLSLPNVDACADPRTLAGLAREAEAAGWDGVFVWDCVYIRLDSPVERPLCDPWIALAAIATATERIRLGTIVTPLSRRRPWNVARQCVSLDHLSNGRLILPVGLGALTDGGFTKVGEVLDRRLRAEMLDESLTILDGLWRGEAFSFRGRHYQLDEMTFLPRPVQEPRVPIWVIGAWPREKSMARVIRWDGAMPAKVNAAGEFAEALDPDDLRALRTYAAERRGAAPPLDIVSEGNTPGDEPSEAAAQVRPLAEAGVTWWIESVWSLSGGLAGMRRRIQQGPPPVA